MKEIQFGQKEKELMRACETGNVRSARMVIGNGAQVDAIAPDGRTALDAAIISCSATREVVELLLDHGAHVDINPSVFFDAAAEVEWFVEKEEEVLRGKLDCLARKGYAFDEILLDPWWMFSTPGGTVVVELLAEQGAFIDFDCIPQYELWQFISGCHGSYFHCDYVLDGLKTWDPHQYDHASKEAARQAAKRRIPSAKTVDSLLAYKFDVDLKGLTESRVRSLVHQACEWSYENLLDKLKHDEKWVEIVFVELLSLLE